MSGAAAGAEQLRYCSCKYSLQALKVRVLSLDAAISVGDMATSYDGGGKFKFKQELGACAVVVLGQAYMSSML